MPCGPSQIALSAPKFGNARPFHARKHIISAQFSPFHKVRSLSAHIDSYGDESAMNWLRGNALRGTHF
jgi:hypothetical protein